MFSVVTDEKSLCRCRNRGIAQPIPMDLHIFRTASDVAFFQYLLETTESVRIRKFIYDYNSL
jgi:hypothetical protein